MRPEARARLEAEVWKFAGARNAGSIHKGTQKECALSCGFVDQKLYNRCDRSGCIKRRVALEDKGMAQPAWVVRARRAQIRRQLLAADRLTRHQARKAVFAVYLAKLGYISQTLQPARRRRIAAVRAALAARSVLENVPLETYTPNTPAVEPSIHAWMDLLSHVSPRIAAHTIAISIVMVVALFTTDLRLSSSVLGRSLPLANQQFNGDMQIQRQIVGVEYPGNEEQALAGAPIITTVAEPMFADYHVLMEGETLGQLATRYQVSVESIFWANDLAASHVFGVGQELRIPRMTGITHVIEAGETLESIAARFQVQPQAIVLFAPNGVRADQPLPIGQEIFLPGGMQTYPEEYLAQHGGAEGIAGMRAVVAGMVQESQTTLRAGPGRDYSRLGYLDAGLHMKLLARHKTWVKVDNGAGVTGWVRADLLGLSDTNLLALSETNDFPPPPPRWIWPTRGVITSPFGWRRMPWRMFHDGLDIANDAGTKIYSASAGQVSEAGWCRGFGYCVKIDHGDGVTSIYGHMLRRPPVHTGDAVGVGDLIGLMGSSYDARGGGYSTGVHLHFTIKVSGKAVNPLKFLP
jgi:murein DD-endopeptidase MepM/ murein hydrolase activator NlpD